VPAVSRMVPATDVTLGSGVTCARTIALPTAIYLGPPVGADKPMEPVMDVMLVTGGKHATIFVPQTVFFREPLDGADRLTALVMAVMLGTGVQSARINVLLLTAGCLELPVAAASPTAHATDATLVRGARTVTRTAPPTVFSAVPLADVPKAAAPATAVILGFGARPAKNLVL
jgi:hypothetical protein